MEQHYIQQLYGSSSSNCNATSATCPPGKDSVCVKPCQEPSPS